MERQRQKALEIERERERAMQQAFLKKEAEQREAERKRKDEWMKRRCAELEQEKKHEQEELGTLKHRHQAIVDELTKHELEKLTMKQRIEQERQRCAQLASGLDKAKNQQINWRDHLVGVASELNVRAKYMYKYIENNFSIFLIILILELATRVKQDGVSEATTASSSCRTNDRERRRSAFTTHQQTTDAGKHT